MGYYTRYSLDGCKNRESISEEEQKEIMSTLCNISSYFEGAGFTSFADIEASDEMKWYSHDTDILTLSKLYPHILFVLEGYGEDREDVWRAVYMDGEMDRARASLVYEPFTKWFAKSAFKQIE